MKTAKMSYDEIVSHSSVRSCKNCQMNMGGVCAGSHYGEKVTKQMIANSGNCSEWEMDIHSFMSLCSAIDEGKV